MMMMMMMVKWRNGGMEVGVATKNGDTCGKACSQQKLRQTMDNLSRFCLFLVVHCKWNASALLGQGSSRFELGDADEDWQVHQRQEGTDSTKLGTTDCHFNEEHEVLSHEMEWGTRVPYFETQPICNRSTLEVIIPKHGDGSKGFDVKHFTTIIMWFSGLKNFDD